MKNRRFLLMVAGYAILLALSCVEAPPQPVLNNENDPAFEGFVPDPPGTLSVTQISDKRIALNWANGSGFQQFVTVERRAGNSSFSAVATLADTATSFLDTLGVSIDSTYTYRVCAVSEFGIVNCTIDSIRPLFPRPVNLALTDTMRTSVVLRWDDPSGFAEGFVIERAENGGPFGAHALTPPAPRLFVDGTVDTTKSYDYRVRSFTTINTTQPSLPVKALFLQTFVPGRVYVNAGSPDGVVTNITYSTDGTTIYLTQGSGTSIRAFSTSTGLQTAVYVDSAQVGGIGVSVDGMTLGASVYGQSTSPKVRVWDVVSGTLIRSIETQFSEFFAMHPGGTMVAAESTFDTVKIWDVATGNVVQSFHSRGAMIFTPDGEALIGPQGLGGTLTVWRISDGTQIGTGPGGGTTYGLDFSNDGTLLGVRTSGVGYVWHYPSMMPVLEENPLPTGTDVAIDRTNQYVAFSYSFGLRVFRLAASATSHANLLSGEHVYSVDFSPTGPFMVTGSDTGAKEWVMVGRWFPN